MSGGGLKRELAAVLLAFLVSRAAFLGPAYAFWLWHKARGLPPPAPPGYVETGQGPLDWRPLNLLVFYDAVHYLSIAWNGYDSPYRTCWFPLYPLLIRAFGGAAASAVFVSNAAFFFALLAARRLGGPRAMWLTAFNPVGLLTSAVYSESLFLALFGWMLVLLESGRRREAALLAGLAALVRPTGWAAAAGAVLALAWRRDLRGAAEAAALAGLVGAAYPLYLWLKFGDPLLFVRANGAWFGRELSMFPAGLLADLAAWEGKDFGWRLQFGVNLFGFPLLLMAAKARPAFGLPYALSVVFFPVMWAYAPSVLGLLRYAAGCFPWCLKGGSAMLAVHGALGVFVSFLLAGKNFIF
jgi:hypothetical protein